MFLESKLHWACRQASFQIIVLQDDFHVDKISYEKLRIKFYNFALKHSLSWLNEHDFYFRNGKITEFNKRLLLSGSRLDLCTFYKNKDDYRKLKCVK